MAKGALVAPLCEQVEQRLQAAFECIARCYLHPTSDQAASTPEHPSWRALAAAVQSRSAPVDIGSADLGCPPDVTVRRWNRTEVLNCLRHMEVLLGAIHLIKQSYGSADFRSCHPTQTGGTEGDRCADLEGEVGVAGSGRPMRFTLEAYGGVNYQNNSKAALDFDALRWAKEHEPDILALAAFRKGAITGTRCENKDWKEGQIHSAACQRKDAKGEPAFKISARIAERFDDAYYVVIALDDFKRSPQA